MYPVCGHAIYPPLYDARTRSNARRGQRPALREDFGPAAAEKNIEVCKSLIDLANIQKTLSNIPARKVKVTFGEWNVWDQSKAPGSADMEQTYDYTDMLGFCAWLSVLVRKHKDVESILLVSLRPSMSSP